MSDKDSLLSQKIDQTVDSMVTMLKNQIISPSYGAGGTDPRRGIWDRFKNWMSNMWYGRYSSKNPYYFMNTLGDFAGSQAKPDKPKTGDVEKDEEKKESFCPLGLSLSEYHTIKSLFDKLEIDLGLLAEMDLPPGAENLRVMRMIDDWGKNLKLALKKIMMDHERTTPDSPPPKPESAEEKECIEQLDKKHAEGKISDSEYERIKLMISHGRIDMACRALSSIKSKPADKPTMSPEIKARIDKAFRDLEVEHNRPGVGNAMPDDIYERIKSELQSLDSSTNPDIGKLSELEREITGIAPSETTSTEEPKDETHETEFPYNKGDDLGSFLNIKRELRSKAHPVGADQKYGDMFENWNNSASRSQKKSFYDLETQISDLLEERPDGFESEYSDLLKTYKQLVSRIVRAGDGDIEHDIEESASVTKNLTLSEKTIYYKKLLSRS